MWIKTSNGMLINLDQVIWIDYAHHPNETLAYCTDCANPEIICFGDARQVISQAIQRDQKYLEVNDCE